MKPYNRRRTRPILLSQPGLGLPFRLPSIDTNITLELPPDTKQSLYITAGILGTSLIISTVLYKLL